MRAGGRPAPRPTSTSTATPTATPTLTRASIGGRVWQDTDRDGRIDAGEPGMTAATLLLEFNNAFIAQTTIDANGNYVFANLEPNQIYRVHVDEASLQPVGYSRTTANNPLIVMPSPGQNIRSADFGYAPPIQPNQEQIDLWVMGVEVNQGLQDFVFTDLANPGNRRGFADPEFANPLIPGKPAVVRVYVGLRDSANRPPTPTDGFTVTGELRVQRNVPGDSPVWLRPVVNANCTEQSGTSGQTCKGSIGVFPSLGRQGLDTNTDFDLDLISERIHLEGTLNFVIPPTMTANFDSNGVVLTVDVWPVLRQEISLVDNRFELQLDNVAAPRPLNIDLIRIGGVEDGVDMPVPTTAASRRAMNQMLQLTPYDRVNFNRNRTFRPSFDRIPVRFIDTIIYVINACNALWVRMFWAFGGRALDGRTVYGLTPNGISLGNCTGLGWKIPGFGGIGYSEIPAFAATSELIQTADDADVLGTVAQELHHAHLGRRHVSNDHGEADGCILDGVAEDIVDFTSNIDTDCWKVPLHLHGVMGEYPAGKVKIGGGNLIGRVFGDRGAVGLRIEKPVSEDWRLTLFDPCPTGPLDQSDPLSRFGQRWNITTSRYRCDLGAGTDDIVPHDFMSYGPNPWTSEDQFQGVTTPALNPEPVERISLSPSAVSAEPALLVTGVISASGEAGFVPLMPSVGGAMWTGPTGSPLTLTVQTTQGQTLTLPVMLTLASAHPNRWLFFAATLPSGAIPSRLGLNFKNQEIAALTASAHAPTVRVLWPNGGERLQSPGTHVIRWEASDQDGDALTFLVESSADGGLSWQPLGFVTNQTVMAVSAEAGALDPSLMALVRVTATDGMNTASDQSDSVFAVGNHLYLPLLRRQ